MDEHRKTNDTRSHEHSSSNDVTAGKDRRDADRRRNRALSEGVHVSEELKGSECRGEGTRKTNRHRIVWVTNGV